MRYRQQEQLYQNFFASLHCFKIAWNKATNFITEWCEQEKILSVYNQNTHTPYRTQYELLSHLLLYTWLAYLVMFDYQYLNDTDASRESVMSEAAVFGRLHLRDNLELYSL